MALLMIRYALCPVCRGAGYVQARQGGPCAHCQGTGAVQHGGTPRYRVHDNGGRWDAVNVDAHPHVSSLLVAGAPTSAAAAAHAESLGYIPDPRPPGLPVAVPTWEAGTGPDASVQLTLDLRAETIAIQRRSRVSS